MLNVGASITPQVYRNVMLGCTKSERCLFLPAVARPSIWLHLAERPVFSKTLIRFHVVHSAPLSRPGLRQ